MSDQQRELDVHVDEPAGVEDLEEGEQAEGGQQEDDQHDAGGAVE